MGFKTVEKPYTKADYYREMEARHAAKIAAKAAPVVVVPVKEPEWLEPENVTELSTNIVEEVVIPFVEPSIISPITEQEAQAESVDNAIDVIADEVNLPLPQEEPAKKVTKQKRKKSG